MAFHNENKQFTSISAFASYLHGLPKAKWSIGSTFHNTYIPDIQDWNGSTSMLGMESFYIGKGWDRGPHCYVAKGSPDPENDGIWVMTPPNLPGIHAGVCNGDDNPLVSGRFGIELVGDFNVNAPDNEKLELLADTIATLHYWNNLPADVNAHRDCMPGRTCPGNAFYAIKQQVIDMVTDRLSLQPSDTWDLWGTKYPLEVAARQFGIPKTWYANMQGPVINRLGAAQSDAVYDSINVTQLFEHGLIIYRNQSTRIIMYRDFRVP